MEPSAIEQLQPTSGHVVMMCGIAGSGKTTYAKALEAKGFVRISIDEYIWEHFGRFGVDYPEAQYEKLQGVAERSNLKKLEALIHKRFACVVDYSFWSKAQRVQYRKLVESAGGQVTLLYLRAAPEILRSRLKARGQARSANAAFAINEKTLEQFVAGFEEPSGDEGAMVVVQNA